MRQVAVTVGLLAGLAAACTHMPPAHRAAATGNHPPAIRARCEPCTVSMGRTSTLSADAQDPDGDALAYTWRTPAGTLATPAARQTSWTAPMLEGPVPVTVRIDDGKGATASDVITILVVK